MADKAVYAETAGGRTQNYYNSGSSVPKTLRKEYIPESQIGFARQPRAGRRAKAEPVTRPAERVSPLAVIGFLAIAVMAAVILCTRVQLNSLNNEIVEASSQLTALQQIEDNLNNEYQQVFDMSDIESGMEAGGKMVTPNSTQQIYLELSEPDTSETYEVTGGILGRVLSALNQAIEFFR